MEKEIEIDKIYCIDTSVFVWTNRYYNIDRSWSLFERLFVENKIISHVLVYEELTNQSSKPDFVSNWLKPRKNFFQGYSQKQVEFVTEILEKFPHLIKAKNEKNQADPWLIALAKEHIEEISEEKRQQTLLFPDDNPKQKEIIVVSCEKVDHPSRIPAVCKGFGIKHINLLEFFADNGLVLTWEKI